LLKQLEFPPTSLVRDNAALIDMVPHIKLVLLHLTLASNVLAGYHSLTSHELNASVAGTAHKNASTDRSSVYLVIQQRCEAACGYTDSSCVPECEVKMYKCIQYAEEKDRQTCMGKVISDFNKFKKTWNASHAVFMAHRNVRLEAIVQGRCKQACGPDTDASCMPECQVKMYHCIENGNPTESELDKCFDGVETEFKSFAEKWNSTHPSLLVHKRNFTHQVHFATNSQQSAVILKGCKEACGAGVDTTCVPQCQTEMFWCLDHDPPYEVDEQKECMEEVIAEYKKFGQEWEKKHPYFLARN